MLEFLLKKEEAIKRWCIVIVMDRAMLSQSVGKDLKTVICRHRAMALILCE